MGHRCSKLWRKGVIKSAVNRRYPSKKEMTGTEHRVWTFKLKTQKVNTGKQTEKPPIIEREQLGNKIKQMCCPLAHFLKQPFWH